MVGMLLALWLILAQAPGLSVWLVSMRAPCRATVVRAFARRWTFTPGAWPNRATAPSPSRKRTSRVWEGTW
jgi:hypothetical protein